MAMQLNIKDAETVRMVREYAAQTGRTVTATVRAAIENDRRKREAEIAETIRGVQEMLKGSKDLWKPEWRDRSLKEVMDSIYDDDELPE